MVYGWTGLRFEIAWPELSLNLSLQIINSSRPQFESCKNQRIQPNKNQPSGQVNRETNHGNVNCLVSTFQVPLLELKKPPDSTIFLESFSDCFKYIFAQTFLRQILNENK